MDKKNVMAKMMITNVILIIKILFGEDVIFEERNSSKYDKR